MKATASCMKKWRRRSCGNNIISEKEVHVHLFFHIFRPVLIPIKQKPKGKENKHGTDPESI
jgi:hypothetical protein